jgi:PAS domain S-box-containing protein
VKDATNSAVDPDLWPCGLIVMDANGLIKLTNSTLRSWFANDTVSLETGSRFVDILTRASRIFFETHLRPILAVEGEFAEISIELETQEGTRIGVFVNGRATLIEGRLTEAHFCLFKNEQRQSFERELVAKRRESEEFRILVASSPHAIMSADTDLKIHAWNPAAENLFGYSKDEVLGKRFDELLVPADEKELTRKDQSRVASGEVLRSESGRLHKDGSIVHVERSVAAIYDERHNYIGFVTVYSDISERKASQEKIQTLLHEINHRSKNLLTIVGVIARQTGRLYEGEEFLKVFSRRLSSLASNQTILINSGNIHVDLKTLASAQFDHLVDVTESQVSISGPIVHLNETVSQAIGMALFELVTNAAKYGALSQGPGRVDLTWIITEDASPNLHMSWVETGGPAVVAPTRAGFGSQVTGPILESSTSGKTTREYKADGLHWTFSAPFEELTRQDTDPNGLS